MASATPHEVTLAEPTLAAVRVPRRGRGRWRMRPQRIIADRGYHSDPLRRRLRRRGIELMVPYRRNQPEQPYQDGRTLRRYRRRWKIQRTFAWFSNFRRLQVWQSRILSVFSGLLSYRLPINHPEVFSKPVLVAMANSQLPFAVDL